MWESECGSDRKREIEGMSVYVCMSVWKKKKGGERERDRLYQGKRVICV